jgi:hypothetical protein
LCARKNASKNTKDAWIEKNRHSHNTSDYNEGASKRTKDQYRKLQQMKESAMSEKELISYRKKVEQERRKTIRKKDNWKHCVLSMDTSLLT